MVDESSAVTKPHTPFVVHHSVCVGVRACVSVRVCERVSVRVSE